MSHRSPLLRWCSAALALVGCTVVALPAHARPKDRPGEVLMGLAAVALLLVAMGLAVGSFSLTVNHIFRKRSATTFRVLCARPGWSLLAGLAITLLGLGLLAVLHGAGPLQLLVLVGYLGGLLLFAIAAATRLAGRILDPTVLDDEPPEPRLLLKAGLLLLAINIVPFIGTMLFFGILFAAVGATLLGYFARLGGPLTVAAGAGPTPAPPPQAGPTPTVPAAPAVEAGDGSASSEQG